MEAEWGAGSQGSSSACNNPFASTAPHGWPTLLGQRETQQQTASRARGVQTSPGVDQMSVWSPKGRDSSVNSFALLYTRLRMCGFSMAWAFVEIKNHLQQTGGSVHLSPRKEDVATGSRPRP